MVITGGKEGLFDALDAATGKYIKTVDMGLQDFIERIDPETGDKTVEPDKLPGPRQRAGVRLPARRRRAQLEPDLVQPEHPPLFVNARDVCMDMVPARGPGFLTTGVNIQYAPPPDSDGNYGVLQALDMEARQGRVGDAPPADARHGHPDHRRRRAVHRLDGPPVRRLRPGDGRELWSTGVTGVPNASPITYAVDGKQYVAIVTGHGNPLAFGIARRDARDPLPPVNSSALYVFALPEQGQAGR